MHQQPRARDVRSRGSHYASEITFLTLQTLNKSGEGNLLYNRIGDMIAREMEYPGQIQ